MRYIFVLFFCFSYKNTFSKFDKNNKSINSSANVLPKNSMEIGFWSLFYGITDNITITTPSLSILAKNTYTGMRYNYSINSNHKILPYLGISYSNSKFYPKSGFMYGYDFNEKIQLTLGCEIYRPQGEIDQDILEKENKIVRIESSKSTDQFCYFNADYYLDSGNLFFIGKKDQTYIGFTWAYKYTHIGIIIIGKQIPDTPLPFIYWRF